jgi:uncharacterized protein YjbI with pentapeptide repeats
MNRLRHVVSPKGGYLLGLAVASMVGGLVSATVLAAIPSANGTISGCYNNKTGALKVIDSEAGKTCASGQTALNWSQNGSIPFMTNLVGADLSGASLQYRNFTGIDLHTAIFDNANITGSNFTGDNLAGSSFQSVTASKPANFTSANFSGATVGITGDSTYDNDNFGNATVVGLSGSFTGANFVNSNSSGINGNFENFNFTGATLNNPDSDYKGVNLTNAKVIGDISGNFAGVNFSVADPTQFLTDALGQGDFTAADFHGLKFGTGIWGQANLTNSNFTGGSLTNVVFGNVPLGIGPSTFSGTNFTNVTFSGVDFTGNDLSSAVLTGATWSNVTCPDGTNSDSDGNTCIGHLTP